QSSSILWQNHDSSVIIVDIPRSISLAQGSQPHPCSDHLLSCSALERPYDVQNEPKTCKGQANAQAQADPTDLYVKIVESALNESKANFQERFCLGRNFLRKDGRGSGRKRQREESNDNGQPSGAGLDTANLVAGSNISTLDVDCSPGVVVQAQISSALFITNESGSSAIFKIPGQMGDGNVVEYRAPTASTFSLSNCAKSAQFRQDIRDQASSAGNRYRFDMVVLDPPWPNRSVKRTHRTSGSTYHTATNLQGIEGLLHGMDLDMLLEKDGCIGVWITNKPSIRELMLGEGGLFDALGVELVEEWIWLKVTASGEPVTPLQSIWRRPYEVFLVGRKRHQYSPASSVEVAPAVTFRTILAVPDLHSRKPCLKEMTEQLLLRREKGQSRVLEVFARHLVAGWWSWGDECIKFNSRGCW
ncbi:MT-A70-domain-containing protein, partial [Polychaeton citri CBS 116435]